MRGCGLAMWGGGFYKRSDFLNKSKKDGLSSTTEKRFQPSTDAVRRQTRLGPVFEKGERNERGQRGSRNFIVLKSLRLKEELDWQIVGQRKTTVVYEETRRSNAGERAKS